MPLTNLLPALVREPLRRVRHELRGLWIALREPRRPLLQQGPTLRLGVPEAQPPVTGLAAEAPRRAVPAPSPVRARAPKRAARTPAVAPSGQRHVVLYSRRAVRLEVAEDDTLLAAALEAGLDLPHACQRGLCGTCKARLVSGQVQMSEPNALGDEERARGFCLPCVSHPRSAVELDA